VPAFGVRLVTTGHMTSRGFPLAHALGRILFIAGLVSVVLGLLLTMNPSLPLLGKLPGDLQIDRGGLRIYFPITSCLLISAVLSAGLWLLSKLR
jgi:Protein of unknown function (DUF2905)